MATPITFEDIEPGDRILAVVKDRDLVEYLVFIAHEHKVLDLLQPVEQWTTEKGIVAVSRYVNDPDTADYQLFRLESVDRIITEQEPHEHHPTS